LIQETTVPSSIMQKHGTSNMAIIHGDMLLGLIFTPRLYRHIPWPVFHVPVVKLDPPKSIGDTYTLSIDRHTAEMTDICGAFKSFRGVKKYFKISLVHKFVVIKILGSFGFSMLQYILVPHLKAKYPKWIVELDTEILYGNGKHKPTFN
jgi:hypothetical protein